MPQLVQIVTWILSALVILGQLLLVVWLGGNVFFRKTPWAEVLREKEGEWALRGALIVALIATLGSLFYSEIAHYTPCLLCWYQRIFMYPQVILLGIAVWKKDTSVAIYSLALSIIGVALALYHYLLQLGVAPELPCAAIGYSAACSQRFVLTFGYITIPLMALTAFFLIIVSMVTAKKKF